MPWPPTPAFSLFNSGTSKVADYFDEVCLQTQMNTGIKNDPITEADRIADHILQRFFI